MVSRDAPPRRAESDNQRSTALSLLIEHYREVCKLSEGKRERADALSAAQVTAATALGAILVTAAKSLPENQVPEAAAWGVLVALALTIVSAVLARATIVSILLRARAAEVRDEHDQAKAALIPLQDDAAGTGDATQPTDVEHAVLRYWVTRTEVNEDALFWKHRGSFVAGGFLLVAVGMLGWIGISVVDHIW